MNGTFTVKGHRKVAKKVLTSFKMSSFSHYLELKTAKRKITVMDINNSYAWIISIVFRILRIMQSKTHSPGIKLAKVSVIGQFQAVNNTPHHEALGNKQLKHCILFPILFNEPFVRSGE